MSSILILAALDLEARALGRALGLVRTSPTAFARGDGDARDGVLQLRTIGIGAALLSASLDGLQPAPPTCIVMAGLGGGLDPSLRTGDLVLDGCSEDLAAEIPARAGRIYSAGRIIGSVREKAELFATTGACVVDMESAAVRATAAGFGCRFISLRAVCDTAVMALGPALANCIDPIGRPLVRSLAFSLIRRPALIAELVHLQSASQVALRSLESGISRLVAAIHNDA